MYLVVVDNFHYLFELNIYVMVVQILTFSQIKIAILHYTTLI